MEDHDANSDFWSYFHSRFEREPGDPYYQDQHDDRFLKIRHIPIQPQEWIIAPLIPAGEITVIVGDPNIGKTTLQAAFGALVSSDQLAHRFVEESKTITADLHGKVLWVALEDSRHTTLAPRARAAGADEDNFAIWVLGDKKFSLYRKNDESTLMSRIRAYPGVALVMLDNLDLIYSGYPETRAGRRQALLDLTQLAREKSFGVIACAHYGKSPTKTTNPLDRISGGNFIGPTVRKVLYVEELPRSDENPERREFALFDTKANIAGGAKGFRYAIEGVTLQHDGQSIATSKVRWLGELERALMDELLDHSRKALRPKSNKLNDAKEHLLAFFADGAQLSADYKKTSTSWGFSRHILDAACQQLGIDSWKKKGAGRYSPWVYGLPAHRDAKTTPENESDLTDHQVNQVVQVIDEKPENDAPGDDEGIEK